MLYFSYRFRLLAALAILLSIVPISLVAAAPGSLDHPSISKICGEATMRITCDASSPGCERTTLALLDKDGKESYPVKPKGMEEYTAVGLACSASRDGTPYFFVSYGERPRGCGFCEWSGIYKINGDLLTNNDPPILHDKELPEGRQSYPNNREVNNLMRSLGIKRPKWDFFR